MFNSWYEIVDVRKTYQVDHFGSPVYSFRTFDVNNGQIFRKNLHFVTNLFYGPEDVNRGPEREPRTKSKNRIVSIIFINIDGANLLSS